MQFSIVIPTLNESENVDLLLSRLFALDLLPGSFEIIFVDDGSKDGTPNKIREWKAHNKNIHLIERQEKPDLTASILAGASIAKSDTILVMDADLSHLPEQVPAVVAPVLSGKYDVAVGSRYVSGGSTHGWPLYRQWLSRAGGLLARPICDVSDATSGFFAFRRELIVNIPEKARGYKILLELLMSSHEKLRVIEIPISFHDRAHGTSKLSLSHNLIYLQRLITLAGGTVSIGTASRFAIVGFVGVFVDALVFQWLINSSSGLALAHITSFLTAVTINYILNSKWSFRPHFKGSLDWHQFGRFLTVGLLALLLRGGVLALLVYTWHLSAELAIFPAIAATAIINYLGSAFYVFPENKNCPPLNVRWQVAAVGIVLFVILLRLVYLGLAQLIPDEAYYWQYSQHMDLSFFDHPPMVAWLIWLGTAIAGQNEFGVRIGAFICGLITMGYLYAFARNLYDKSTGMRAIMLFSVLPFGFASGLIMTPDAPLIASWAATLYYMERALIADRKIAWLGMGIAFGLGLLSKYTVGLLGIAALTFVILDPTARRWLLRPHPYFSAFLALLLFLPVIIWNFQNDWVSFLFQTERLGGGGHVFSVHYLIFYVAIILTPIGLYAALHALWHVCTKGKHDKCERRRNLFVCVFTGIPLIIFLGISTFDTPRFHWTCPLWLAVLPTIAWMLGQNSALHTVSNRLRAIWQPTIIVSLLAYAFILHYAVLGIPGIPYQFLAEHYFWKEAAIEVEKIAEEIRSQNGQTPIVVGMNKWSIASALSFYTKDSNKMDIRSRNMFGDNSAMYDFWYPSHPATDRPIILIGMKHHTLEQDRAGNEIDRLLIQPSTVQYRTVTRDGAPLRRLYYRTALGYRGRSI
ncbi:glycosyltransferase family 39 protein [Nitrosomonas sp. Is37]|uniref:glycosyltransferase family 39 protein n=1 Tax=Nitrosomonas sp. Is37 TaxID=3080535 RepID=UPI00294B4C48|nr:glycosyltransferase family 39 protein [Nitrosomonas sp. Is37]MDV6343553.1 glycosyltransferase family 39 protein [Nitrosomonas sp. Is37]